MPHTPPRRGLRSTKIRAVAVTSAVALVGPAMVTLAPAAPATAAVDCSTVAWMDTSMTPEQRADALLAASSQHQKYRWLNEQAANTPTQTTWSGGVEYPVQVDCTPTVVYTDGPEGVRANSGVTTFPSQISLASTWSTDLANAKGTAMGDESFDQRRNGILAPGLASARTPLAGRTPEYFGEDPVLSGLLGAAQVNGIQNPTGDRAVMGELKHYVANEQETDRQTSSSNVSERALREIYELPYQIALSASAPASVMCSFNQINGTYACENDRLRDVLKKDLGFTGYVVSDFGAVHSTAQSLMNGLDQELNRPVWFTPEKLDAALAAGEITQSRIDGAAKRVVTAYIKNGLFDHPMADTAVGGSTEAHQALARTLSEEGSVLLKNDRRTLPLSPKKLKVAVIGATASSTPTGGVSATTICSLYLPFGGGRNTMPCSNLVSPEDGIRSVVEAAGGTVTWDPGTDLDAARRAAAAADVTVVFGYQRMGEFSDLANLNLQGGGDDLIAAVAGASKKTVVVLQTGSAVEMPWLSSVDSVLETWYPGDQMGTALADILFGKVNPSGKLTMTFPKSLADTPTAQSDEQYPGIFSDGTTTRPAGTSEIRQVNYTEELQVGYRWYAAQGIDPLFPFGYGLSYTRFAYSKLQVSPLYNGKSKRDLQIRFRLTNTGRLTGTETAQAYVQLPARTDEPSKRLLAWQKVTLKPGQHKTVTIRISAKDLAAQHLLQYWDTRTDSWQTAKGIYKVTVGGSFDTSLTDYSLVWNW